MGNKKWSNLSATSRNGLYHAPNREILLKISSLHTQQLTQCCTITTLLQIARSAVRKVSCSHRVHPTPETHTQRIIWLQLYLLDFSILFIWQQWVLPCYYHLHLLFAYMITSVYKYQSLGCSDTNYAALHVMYGLFAPSVHLFEDEYVLINNSLVPSVAQNKPVGKQQHKKPPTGTDSVKQRLGERSTRRTVLTEGWDGAPSSMMVTAIAMPKAEWDV